MIANPSLTIRYAACGDWSRACQASPHDWLTPAEQGELERWRDEGRRAQWLAGRWLGKQLIRQASAAQQLTDIEVLTRDARGLGVRPRIAIDGRDRRWSLSISHTALGVLVGLAATDQFSLGVDLACGVPASGRFQQLWFSPAEQRWIGAAPERRTALLWALKEALYKADNRGEPWAPQQIEVLPIGQDQFRCSYYGRPVHPLRIEWHEFDQQVAAIVCLSNAPALYPRAATFSVAEVARLWKPHPNAPNSGEFGYAKSLTPVQAAGGVLCS